MQKIKTNPLGNANLLINRSFGFKILVSVAAGLLCLVFSDFSFAIESGNVGIDVPWSLVFPFVIALAYGPQYGIISGVFGGAIYPFFLWPVNGWANVLTGFYLLVLFFLVGFYSNYRNREPGKNKRLRMKVFFSVFYAVLLYLSVVYLFNVFLSINPPFWTIETINFLPTMVLRQFYVKDVINFSLLIVFSDALVNTKQIRKLLGLSYDYWMRNNTKVLLLSIAVSILIWLLIYFLNGFLLSQKSSNDEGFISFSFFILFWSGGILGRVLIHYQELSLKSRQDLIEAKQKAEESDRLKSAFLANMSHEIRTPMNGILGFTSLLKDPGLNGNKQLEYIEIIQKSGNRMLNTVNDIIEISKIETAQVKIYMKKIDVKKQIENLIHFFKPEADKKGIQLFFDESGYKGFLEVETDESKFASVLTNLIKNAIKFTQKGFVKVSMSFESNNLFVSVQDSGIGILPDRQKAIFNRFEQADIEDSQAFEGSGLGLAISKSYVEMLGGTMLLDSVFGKGSTFSFNLPVVQLRTEEKGKNIENSKENKSSNRNLVILVAEDDEPSFMHLSILLRNYSKEIIHAKNGIEAIDVCRKNSDVNLVLMDIKMPLMDGIQATGEIRKFNKDIKIIAQTAYSMQGDKENFLDIGCDDYISKPISKVKLQGLLEKYFPAN